MIAHAHARREIILVWMHQGALIPVAVLGGDQRATTGRTEVRHRILVIEDGGKQLVAQTIVYSEVRLHTPGILRKEVVSVLIIVHDGGRRELGRADVAQQKIGNAQTDVAGVD